MLLGTGRCFGVDDLYNLYLLNLFSGNLSIFLAYQGFSRANKLRLWYIV